MNRWSSVVIVLSLLTTLSAESADAVRDLGTIFPGTTLHQTVTITNNRDQAWSITHIETSCTCTKATPALTEIPAHGQTQMDLAIVGRIHENLQAIRVTLVGTVNGKEVSQDELFRLHVAAAAILQSPEKIDLGIINPSDFPTKPFHFILTRGANPTPWDSAKATISPEHGAVSVLFTRDGNAMGVDISVDPTTRTIGAIGGTLEISFSNGDHALPWTLRRAVFGRIIGKVRADPGAILVGVVKQGEVAEESVSLVPEAQAGAIPDITAIDVSDGERAQAREHVDASGGHLLTVRVTGTGQSQASGDILVHFADGTVLRVPYIATVEPK